MKTLNNDIKDKKFQKSYLLFGEETYLKNLYKNKLKAAVVPDDSMNYNYFEGKGIDINEVIDICDTLPFFADKRLVILQNTGYFKSSQDTIVNYIDMIPESAVVVFVESEVDKRNKLYKRIKGNGYVCELNTPSESQLEKWVYDIIKRDNKNITRETMTLFLDTVGNDMETILQELEKLLCYTLGRDVVTNNDVSDVCTERIEVKIFDLFNAIAAKNKIKTMDIYYDLIGNKEPLMRIMFMLSRQFNQLISVKDMTNKGYSKKDIAAKMSLRSDWQVGQLQKQCSGYSIQSLKSLLKMCVKNEEAVKNGNLKENTAVEMILVKALQIK